MKVVGPVIFPDFHTDYMYLVINLYKEVAHSNL